VGRRLVWQSPVRLADAQRAGRFFAINDNIKVVQALYLTPETTDGKFVSDWARRASTVGAASSLRLCCKPNSAGFPAPQRADRLPARAPVSHGSGTLENRALNHAAAAATGQQCPPTPAIPAAFRRQSTPRPPHRSGATPHKCPRKRLRVMRNHAHRAKFSAAGMCV